VVWAHADLVNPANIDEYLAPRPADQRAALQRLRAQIKAAAPGAEECIGYGLAGFKLDGHPLLCLCNALDCTELWHVIVFTLGPLAAWRPLIGACGLQ